MRVAFSSMAWNTGSSSPGERLMTFSTSEVADSCSNASSRSRKARLFLQFVSGYLCGWRFAGLGPIRALTLYRLSASTASLHVARLRRFTIMLNPMQILAFAPRQDVRFGSLADISQCNRHVRFTPESGHSQA
jgi:hypothetical protein